MQIEEITNTIGKIYIEIASNDPGPDKGLWVRDAMRVFNKISIDKQKAMILETYEGERSAAEKLGVPIGTLKSRCSRGRSEIKKFDL